MINIMNYSRQLEYEIETACELETLAEQFKHEEYELKGSMSCLSTLSEAMHYLELDETEQAKIDALGAYDSNYYDSIVDIDLDDRFGMIIEGASSDYELARKLEYTIGLDEELYRVLGCSSEAYEQLSSFIHTDDIAHTIDQEFTFVYVDGTAYELIA